MIFESFKCPISKVEFPDPEKRLEHHMTEQKGLKLS
jgi:hypothetical protein